MPNQLNFPEPVILNSPPNSSSDLVERPDRIEVKDLNLILEPTSKEVVFGTTDKDVVELHLYDLNNNYIQTGYLYINDPALSITTIVDEQNQKAIEFLNVDMKSAMESMGIIPGRYLTSMNFVRNEIGSDYGERLYISEISPSRTEIKLDAIDVTDSILKEIYEFIVPAVPRIIAQGLVDQLFSQSNNYTLEESVQSSDVDIEMTTTYPTTMDRITYAGLNDIFDQFVTLSLKFIEQAVLDTLSVNPGDYRIQQTELESYIVIGIEKALDKMVQMGLLDNRMELI